MTLGPISRHCRLLSHMMQKCQLSNKKALDCIVVQCFFLRNSVLLSSCDTQACARGINAKISTVMSVLIDGWQWACLLCVFNSLVYLVTVAGYSYHSV